MKKNLIKTIAVMIAASTLLAGCGSKESNQISELQNKVAVLESALNDKDKNTSEAAKNTEKSNSQDVDSGYSKRLAQFVFQGSEKAFEYENASYSHITCTSELEQKDGSEKVYNYKNDTTYSSADDSYHTWSSVIIIRGDEMVETNPLSSIAKSKIQLKLPLEEGNTWEQTINYNGKDYTMKHEIIEISDSRDLDNICVKSTIDNFYSNGSDYIEAAVYQRNRGIIASERNYEDGQRGHLFSLVQVKLEQGTSGGRLVNTYPHYEGLDINKAFE